ncbi:MAG: helix-turn-helix transcriptional regulator [Eubacteriales bacterium]
MNQKQKINKVKTGLNLYRLIEASGKTRIEIAEYLELESTRVIYDWTSGIKLPSLENLLNLSILFHVSIEDILGT